VRGNGPQLSKLAKIGSRSRSRTRERTALRTAAQLESNSNKARPVVTVGLLAVSMQGKGYSQYIVQLAADLTLDSCPRRRVTPRGVGSEHVLLFRIRSAWIPVSHHAVIVRLTSVVNVDHSGSDRGRCIGTRVVRLRQTTRVYAYSHSRTRIVVLV
jgi:hypothetical protein